MSVHADSDNAVYDAAVAALGRLLWNPPAEECESLPITWYGFDPGSLGVALINEVLYRRDVEDFCFSRFETARVEWVEELDSAVWKDSAKQLKIFGTLYGVRDAVRARQPRIRVSAALLQGMRWNPQETGIEFRCLLDDTAGEFMPTPPPMKPQ